MQITLSPSIQPDHWWWLSLAPETSDRDSIVPSNGQSLGRDSVCDNLFLSVTSLPSPDRYVLSHSILFYPVLSYPSVCLLPSGLVWSCSVLSLVVGSCTVLYYPAAYRPVMSTPVLCGLLFQHFVLDRPLQSSLHSSPDCPGLSFSVWSCTFQYRQGRSYFAIFHLILSCPTLLCPISSLHFISYPYLVSS